jgi:hypothetical protein
MPKKHHTRRHLRGGFADSLGQTFSNLGNSISQGATNLWNTTKKGVSSLTTSSSSSTSTPYNYVTPYRGGKRSRKTKKSRTMKRGGFNPNVPFLADRANSQISSLPSSTLANNAASFSGKTASAQYVGGKRRKTRRLTRSRH